MEIAWSLSVENLRLEELTSKLNLMVFKILFNSNDRYMTFDDKNTEPTNDVIKEYLTYTY